MTISLGKLNVNGRTQMLVQCEMKYGVSPRTLRPPRVSLGHDRLTMNARGPIKDSPAI